MGKTIVEKIFEKHLIDEPFKDVNIINLDSVFGHEILLPIGINDMIAIGKDKVFDTEKVKVVIDHISPAKDSLSAEQGKVLRDWARRHKLKDFYDIGRNGVCHALFPEKGFIRPGNTVIMCDSHTCTYGAFGAFAAGVGTTDLEVGIMKGVAVFKKQNSIKCILNGKLSEGVYAKDVILFIISELGVNGATNAVLEFVGPVIDGMDMDERMTVCNMAVEAGATSGICYPDMKTVDYLWEFISDGYSSREAALADFSRWKSDKDARYEKVLEHDLSGLEPLSTIGYKPDQVEKVSALKDIKVDQVYIGSCTNGRFEDLKIAAEVLRGNKIHKDVRGILSPATPKVFNRAMEEGILKNFSDAGFCITNPTCGACVGMSNGILASGEICAATTNRNFNGRMGKGGMVHLVSPATAAATAINGYITNSKFFTKQRK